jgi:hypothetical protein
MAEVLSGGCACGAIRYQVSGRPFDETNCHCSICRRASGAPFVAWFSVARAAFRFVRGEPRRFRSSARAMRAFCPDCGTQLTFERDDRPGEIDLTTCSLDDPALVPPKDHTHVSTRVPWVRLCDGLPEHPEWRDDA